MSEALVLAQALDLRAAAPLLQDIRARRGQALILDGSVVERLGGQCLQVLLAAQAAWAADQQGFTILNPSTALKDGWALMGAEPLAPVASAETPL